MSFTDIYSLRTQIATLELLYLVLEIPNDR
jgi:hypothetical protein